MKALGTVRRIDELGRVVLPKDARERMGLNPGTFVEFFATEKGFFLRPYAPGEPEPKDEQIDPVEM